MNKLIFALLVLLVLVAACTPKPVAKAEDSEASVDQNVNDLSDDLFDLSEDLGLDELNDLEQELAELENIE